jgi:hypothetical protein
MWSSCELGSLSRPHQTPFAYQSFDCDLLAVGDGTILGSYAPSRYDTAAAGSGPATVAVGDGVRPGIREGVGVGD